MRNGEEMQGKRTKEKERKGRKERWSKIYMYHSTRTVVYMTRTILKLVKTNRELWKLRTKQFKRFSAVHCLNLFFIIETDQ